MNIIIRILRLFLGLFLFAVGVVMTINANLGLSPWDVFHQGMTHLFNITMGQASIIVGLFLVIIDSLLGEKIGWGTICNMLFIGIFMDLLMLNNVIPTYSGFIPSLLLMLFGMFIIGIASYFYISAGLGSGPRDGLMVALTKRTNKSVSLTRNAIELSALVIGYFLGGYVGLGTLVVALGLGYFVQLGFWLFRFDVKGVQHRFIEDDIKLLKGIIFNRRAAEDTELEE